MAGGDFSGCVEMTSGYFGYNRFDSGKFGIGFDCTGNAGEKIWGKDPTVDATGAVCLLHYAVLSCGSGAVNLVDGSGGASLFGIGSGNVAESSVTAQHFGVWDFKDDPLICLTADNTQSLCISAAQGSVSGFIKVSWGTRPK